MNAFLTRYQKLGEEFDPKKIVVKQAFRVNTLKITDEKLLPRLNAVVDKVPFLKHGYFYESAYSVGAMLEHFMGYVYIQEAASQIPVEVLNPKEKEFVLDMAASPGGKTTQMAAMMNNKGTIIALDANNARLPALRNNLERLGVKNCLVYKKDAAYAKDLKIEFDKVLLDAPCSGNFAVDKEWLNKRKIYDLKEIVKVQKKMLQAGFDVLKTGGVLVYSTCSLEPEENEENIDWFLSENKNAVLEKIEIKVGDKGLTNVFGRELNSEVSKCIRIWPHKTNMQGFFLAKIKKLKTE